MFSFTQKRNNNSHRVKQINEKMNEKIEEHNKKVKRYNEYKSKYFL